MVPQRLPVPSMVSFVSVERATVIVFPDKVALFPEQLLRLLDYILHLISGIQLLVVEFQHPNYDNLNHDEESIGIQKNIELFVSRG